jgi:hypothetical protein
MQEPQRPRGYDGLPAGLGGAVSAFLPQGKVGVLGGVTLLVVLAIASGSVQGIWLVAAVAALIAMVPLLVLAVRAELNADRAAQGQRPAPPRLPDDAELSDEERRDALRRFDDERRDGV